jgi:hypothetical protein
MTSPLKSARRIGLLSLIAAALTPAASFAETPFETWVHRYEPDLGNSPSAHAIAIDRNGFVAVAGYTRSGTDRIYYVARHDPFTGTVIPGWPKTYDSGQGTNEANAVAFDSQGNIIVTGESQTTADGLDYYTRKYFADGSIDWSVRYDGTSGSDRALFVAVDGANNIIVTGRSFIGAVSGDDIYTVKYNGQTGDIMSSYRYTSAGTRTDFPTGLTVDSAGRVIVCGVSTNANGDTEFYVGKYNMSTLAATVDWERLIGAAGRDYEARGVAVDSANNVVVTGQRRNLDNSHGFLTRKYDVNGNTEWTQVYPEVTGDFNRGARAIAVDAEGNVFVTGIAEIDNFNTTFYTAKSLAGNGAIEWSVRGPLVEDESIDVNNLSAVKIAVDPSGNPIIAGSPGIVGQSADFYVAKYSSRNNGAVLWEKAYKGAFPNEGTDTLADMAVDDFGNIAITGDSLREAGTLFEILTIKLGTTALATGDPISGDGIPDNAKISRVYTPATADTGAIAARVTVAAGRKKLGAIVSVGGGEGLAIPAVQGTAAPGISGAEFKSFSDPVMAQNGRIAFIGRVSGAPSSKSTGVWTNAFNPSGTLELALQQGEELPGQPGVILQSVSTISLRNTQLVALIKVRGSGISKANSTMIYHLVDINVGAALMQTGETSVMLEGVEATVKSLTVFTPPKGSAGHGRYHGLARVIARATLDDKRTAIVTAQTNGTVAVLTGTGQSAGSMVDGATWKSFGLPSIDNDGARYATLGTLTLGVGTEPVTKKDDSIIGYSLNGGAFVNVAREGSDAADIAGARYVSLQDPLVNRNGRVAFVGTVSGTGVNARNRTGLWFGAPATVDLIARTNHEAFPATDGSGADIDARWTSFRSLALPGGTNAGPLFLATIAGPGIRGSNGFGLWAVDSTDTVRKLIRNGDELGNLKVKKFVVLQPSAGSLGTTRSFNSGGTVAVLVTFSNKSTGVLNIAIP